MWTIVLILTLMMPAGVAAQTAPAGTPRPGTATARHAPFEACHRQNPRARVGRRNQRAASPRAGHAPGRAARRPPLYHDRRRRPLRICRTSPKGATTSRAGKGGYVTLQYGQRRAFEPGTSGRRGRGAGLSSDGHRAAARQRHHRPHHRRIRRADRRSAGGSAALSVHPGRTAAPDVCRRRQRVRPDQRSAGSSAPTA